MIDGATIDDATADAPVDADPNMPATLMDTGLCVDAACTQIADGIVPYTPRWELWSDGATKKRWIYLPPGTKIDTTDMDYWEFPVGTKLWKEFTRDNIRVETRLVWRRSDTGTNADWFYMPYVWNQTQDMAVAEEFGVPDANGTEHDVPSQFDCKQCHDNLEPTRVLGFGALQLDYDNPTAGELDLQALIDGELLTNPPAAPTTPEDPYYFPLPLDSFGYALPALGYMHANCGHCHNPNSKQQTITPIELRLQVAKLGSLSQTPAYQTTISKTGMTIDDLTTLVIPGDPDNSILFHRFSSDNPAVHMPKIGTEIIDPTGKAILQSWIENLN
jgi:hypothetical protein